MNEANRLDAAVNNVKAQMAMPEAQSRAGIAYGEAGRGPFQAACEPPSAKQLLFEAAHRHQEKAEGLRMLAKLLPVDEALSWEARRTLRAAIEELVSRR